MPELPEVESVRRLLERTLVGRRIVRVEAPEDKLVHSGHKPLDIEEALVGRNVIGAGRKGKTWWLELDRKPWLFGHLGMTGWVRELAGPETRLLEHGKAPLVDAEGRPRFLKLLIEAEDGSKIAFTDGRRLGRIWLVDDPAKDKRLRQLGPDAWLELPNPKDFHKLIARNKAIKAVLMDQSILSGIGNWVADEVLYHARIAPGRLGSSLSERESAKLRKAIQQVLDQAIEVGADFERFPPDWLFHHRWGGKRGKDSIGGKKIVRETIGGRTSAWVPELQK